MSARVPRCFADLQALHRVHHRHSPHVRSATSQQRPCPLSVAAIDGRGGVWRAFTSGARGDNGGDGGGDGGGSAMVMRMRGGGGWGGSGGGDGGDVFYGVHTRRASEWPLQGPCALRLDR